MPRTIYGSLARNKISTYEPDTPKASRVWDDYEYGLCALFQRRLPCGKLQYEAHYLTPRAFSWLERCSRAA